MRRRCFMQHVVVGAAAAALPGIGRAGAASSLLPDSALMQVIELERELLADLRDLGAETGR